MKLTRFQKRVQDLMDSGMTISRHITDELNKSGGKTSETAVSKAMDVVDATRFPNLSCFLTKEESRVLLTTLRFGANEPSDEDFDTFESLLDKFSRALPNQ